MMGNESPAAAVTRMILSVITCNLTFCRIARKNRIRSNDNAISRFLKTWLRKDCLYGNKKEKEGGKDKPGTLHIKQLIFTKPCSVMTVQ